MKIIDKRLIGLCVSILMLALSACAASPAGIPVTGKHQTQTPVVENTLANTSWALTSYGPPTAQTQVIQSTEVNLQFNGDGTAAGTGGCNSFGAEYDITGDHSLKIHNILSTKMACTAQEVMDQEQQYMQALQSAGRFELSGDKLTIWYSGEQGALHFSKAGTGTAAPVQPGSTLTSPAPAVVNPTATSASGNATP